MEQNESLLDEVVLLEHSKKVLRFMREEFPYLKEMEKVAILQGSTSFLTTLAGAKVAALNLAQMMAKDRGE